MGKLNAAKMANFMEVDIYVLVACPESSLLDNQVTAIMSSIICDYNLTPSPSSQCSNITQIFISLSLLAFLLLK